MKPAIPEANFPLVINGENQCIQRWITKHLPKVERDLLKHKAILFRNFTNIHNLDITSKFFFKELSNYEYRSTSRRSLGPNIYTSTEYPKDLSIPQHCENSYQKHWPSKLLFHCITPAPNGGQTPLADMTKVTDGIRAEVKKEFETKGVMYARTYQPGLDLPWQEVFNTSNKKQVEKYCHENNISFQWQSNTLKTQQTCQAMARHPKTSEKIWFNQAHLFHISSLPSAYQQALRKQLPEDRLPRNAYFGDGTRISADILSHVRSAFDKNTVSFDWMENDLLLLDNMLASHGRTPYSGNRTIAVCMSKD